MKLFVGSLALVSMAGCASVGDSRSNPPLLSLQSSKPAKVVAECIRDGWQGTTVLGAGIGGILQTSGDRYMNRPGFPRHLFALNGLPPAS